MQILTISGNLSAQSRSVRLLGHVRAQPERAGERADRLGLHSPPADALLGAQVSDPVITDAVTRVEAAGMVVLTTPVCKAAYSGLLKTLLDLLPQSGLHDKVVLPIATGGSLAHTLVIDYALRPVPTALAAHSILPGTFAVDSQIVVADDNVTIDPPLQQCLGDGVECVHQVLALARHPVVAQVIVPSHTAVRTTSQAADEERIRCLAWCVERAAVHTRSPDFSVAIAPRSRCARIVSPIHPASIELTMRTHSPLRRTLAIAATLLAALGTPATFVNSDAPSPTAAKQLRISYQKYGTLTVFKARDTLEKRLAARGIEVKWTEFPADPQLLKGLNVGATDFGTTGEAPTVFTLTARTHLVYADSQPPAPAGETVIVPKNSPLESVAGLKSKRVIFNEGSNVHYLLVKLLERANMSYNDIRPVYLTLANARATFERSAVDAQVIWDPFFAAAGQQLDARMLADGTGVVNNSQYFPASKGYADAWPDALSIVLDELEKTDTWATANPKDVTNILDPQFDLESAMVARLVSRIAYSIQSVGSEALADQRRIADTFHALKLVPCPVKVADSTWQLMTQQAAR